MTPWAAATWTAVPSTQPSAVSGPVGIPVRVWRKMWTPQPAVPHGGSVIAGGQQNREDHTHPDPGPTTRRRHYSSASLKSPPPCTKAATAWDGSACRRLARARIAAQVRWRGGEWHDRDGSRRTRDRGEAWAAVRGLIGDGDGWQRTDNSARYPMTSSAMWALPGSPMCQAPSLVVDGARIHGWERHAARASGGRVDYDSDRPAFAYGG